MLGWVRRITSTRKVRRLMGARVGVGGGGGGVDSMKSGDSVGVCIGGGVFPGVGVGVGGVRDDGGGGGGVVVAFAACVSVYVYASSPARR